MTLRCKPGDLAVITFCPYGTEHLRGRILRVARRGPSNPQLPWVAFDMTATWHYEGERMRTATGIEIVVVNDCCLRPLRRKGGEDEMLRIAGKPEKAEA